jgi:hypothetical protein
MLFPHFPGTELVTVAQSLVTLRNAFGIERPPESPNRQIGKPSCPESGITPRLNVSSFEPLTKRDIMTKMQAITCTPF